jgi:hypothetical protein
MGRIPADRNFLLHRAHGCRGLNRQFTQLGGGVRGAVFEDGDEEVDGDGRGFDATLVAIALGDDGIGLLSITSSCCCPTTRPSSTSATGVNRWALGGEAFDLAQGAPGGSGRCSWAWPPGLPV